MSRIKNPLPDPLLSVVMPCYNERETIEEIIRRVLAVPIRTELIVVDDGTVERVFGVPTAAGCVSAKHDRTIRLVVGEQWCSVRIAVQVPLAEPVGEPEIR